MTRIVMMVGDGEYGSHETMRAVRRDAADRLGATVNYCTPDVNEDGPEVTAHSYDGLDALADADLMVVYTRFRRLPDVQMKHLAGYLERGGPVVGVRTSTHAFDFPVGSAWASWNVGFGVDVLGSPWISHHGHSSRTRVTRVPGARHEILDGVGDEFLSRSWLYRVRLAGAKPLLTGVPIDPESEPTPGPVAWTRRHRHGGRVFYTSLGHPDDFDLPDFRTLVLNAMRWAMTDSRRRAEVEADGSLGLEPTGSVSGCSRAEPRSVPNRRSCKESRR